MGKTQNNNSDTSKPTPGYEQEKLLQQLQPALQASLLLKDHLQQKWMDGYDVQQILHISRSTLYNWCRKGLLPFSKVEGKIYYDVDDLNEMLNLAKRKRKR